jgi:hypothetical protein
MMAFKLSKDQQAIANKIADTCERLGIDPALGLAVGWAENEFKNRENPTSGAIGPMQVMPANAKNLGLDPADLKDIDINIEAGCKILKENIDKYGDTMLAVAAYNSRPSTVDKALKSGNLGDLPGETQGYLKLIDQMYPLDQPGTVQVAEEKTFTTEPNLPEHVQDPEVPVSTEGLPDWYKTVRPLLAGEKGEIDVDTAEALTGAGGALLGGAEKFGERRAEKAAIEAAKAAAEAAKPGTPGQKWAAETGYGKGKGYTTREVVDAFNRAKPKGLVVKKIPIGTSLNINEQMRMAKQAAELESKLRGAKVAAEAPGVISKALGKIPLGSTLMGVSSGQDIAEAAKELEAGNVTGAGIRAVGGIGGLMSLFTPPQLRIPGFAANVLSEPAAYIQKALRENELRRKQGLAPVTRGQEEIEYDPMGNPVR